MSTVGYGQRLRVQRSADSRVLKAQLDLISDVIHSARFTAPVWAFAIAFVGSSAIGYLGKRSLEIAMILPVLIACVAFTAAKFVTLYRLDSAAANNSERLQKWFPRFVAIQLAISAAWGTMPWILWEPANPLNHIFLAAAVICVTAGLVISRANHMDMLLSCLGPVVTLASLRFLAGWSLLDFGLAGFVPLFGAQLFFDGRRFTSRLV